ncbi:MAG: hypothetical protein J6Y43_03495 [Clostridia bacterium]|nr:hypothetical protein [Clostridia bacterium]
MAQTTKKYQIIQKVSASDTILLHPETDASVVKYDGSSSHLTSTNVKAAVDELKGNINTVQTNLDSFISCSVTGVKGSTESTYRNGQVSLSYEDVGAEHAGTVATHNASSTAHSDIRSTVSTAQNTANEAKSIAQGRARAVAFDTVSAMATALNSAAKTDYKVGDNLFIKALNVPDYWISKVNDSKSGDYGYFEISPLETQSVDLSGYQTKTDNSLATISKTVVGAINEVKSTADTAADDASAARTLANSVNGAVTNIVNGTTKVGKAGTADSATSATTATSAGKWTSPVTLGVSVDAGVKADGSTHAMASGTASVDGHENKTISVTMPDTGVTAGTYSAVQVNSKGFAVAGGQMIEIGASGQTTPSASLATGGLFFKQI